MRLTAVLGVCLFLVLGFFGAAAADQETLLLRYPDIHDGSIVFSYGGDLWLVPEAGGTARRVTGYTRGMELYAKFSPDGSQIAFTGDYDGNGNVYVVPSLGGEPVCLTFHPTGDRVVNWSPDGRVLFASRRGEPLPKIQRLFTVPVTGGLPTPLPMNHGAAASYSPDGKRIAFNRIDRDHRTWKQYRGGTAQDIWTFDFAAQKTTRLTDFAGTDAFPMWQGDHIYFVSDRNGRANLFAHDLATGKVEQLTQHTEYDVKWPSAGPGRIVYELGGALWVYDLNMKQSRRVNVYVPSDRLAARMKWESVGNQMRGVSVSPSGSRVALEARGDLFTVPKKKGPTRNITRSQGVRENNPIWSPDGKSIAYFSDRTGEMEIYVRKQDGAGEEQQVTRDGKVYRYALLWSPDSEKLIFADKDTNLYWVDVDKGRPHLIAHSGFGDFRGFAWSPDSRWIAYEKIGPNRFGSMYLYSLGADKSYRITDETTDDGDPTWDPEGRYVYFFSNREMQPFLGLFDANYILMRATKAYAVVLRKDMPSPFAPESDEEGDEKKKEKEKDEDKDKDKDAKAKVKRIKVDVDGLGERIVAFPIAAGNYNNLIAAGDNVYFVSRSDQPLGSWGSKDSRLVAFDMKKRKEHTVISPVSWYEVSADGKHILYGAKGKIGVIGAGDKKKKAGEGNIKFDGVRMHINPKAEWRQMFMQAWRLERDFFYKPSMGDVDWVKVRDQYAKLLPYISTRDDLNYVLGEMIGELSTSHTYVHGGRRETAPDVNVGQLGADLALDEQSGRYYFKRVLSPDPWDLENCAPLKQPGLDIAEGDFLLAINGHELRAPTNPYALLEDTVWEQITLRVAKSPTGRGERVVTVMPIGSEYMLRYRAWVEKNRRQVAEASDGRLGYVHIPDMSTNGLREFSKAFAAQIDKQGLVVDIRYNGGGFVSEMILERLRRELAGMFASRNFGDETYPWQVIHGPMVCIINEYAGSDGDIFPYFFRQYGLGKIVGRRTWGGVVGMRYHDSLTDGGRVTAPEFGTYGLERKWIMENHGVDPDIEVDLLPEDFLAGRDPQLEMAIRVALDELKKGDYTKPARPE
ncbi:MAG: S41 family peptidase [Candidatus Lernaella stagnicola]|nr:S41 family peptidase [Candidatus Lernaella stagnicola]